MRYGKRYLEVREHEIDKTEWLDILYGLKATGAKKDDYIVELCAGQGLLVDFLRKKGYRNIVGVDLLGDGKKVKCLDLNKEDPPVGQYYIFQHCIEHLDQQRVADLLWKLLHIYGARAIIGIVPGHYSIDPTHVVNHYTREELENLARYVEPRYYLIRYDMASYINPYSSDYLVILSNVPIKGQALPLLFRVFVLATRAMRRYLLWHLKRS